VRVRDSARLGGGVVDPIAGDVLFDLVGDGGGHMIYMVLSPLAAVVSW
jgi:hypothetical protein